MDMDRYMREAARTINHDLDCAENEMHALYGMCSEVGEIHSIYQKAFQGHVFSDEHLIEEIGDLMWMIAELCTVRGYSLDRICQRNIDKLKSRYPDGFDAERSLHREADDISLITDHNKADVIIK